MRISCGKLMCLIGWIEEILSSSNPHHGILSDISSDILSDMLCDILRSPVRSSSAHWDLALAVGARYCTEIWGLQLWSGSDHWDLECPLRSGARGWWLRSGAVGTALNCEHQLSVGTAGARSQCALLELNCERQFQVGIALNCERQLSVGTTGARSQWALPDFNCERQLSVSTAMPSTASASSQWALRVRDLSAHCRTSTVSSRAQWALPELNCECQISVGTAGPQEQLRSGSARWDLALAVPTESWRSQLRAVPTRSWRSQLSSSSAHWDLAPAVPTESWRSQLRSGSAGGGGGRTREERSDKI